MQTQVKPNLEEVIANAKAETEKAKNYLLNTFSFVPDDKLNWSPAPGARSALQLVAHCGMANQAFVGPIKGEDIFFPDGVTDIRGWMREGEAAITDRGQAVKLLEESTAAAIAAIDSVTPELLEHSPNSPFGPMPVPFWMGLLAIHMNAHACQIDYLQTIWGDFDDHFVG
jgi:hypothetical protein